MEQYGFVVPGNAFDRLPFPKDLPERMRRDWILRVLGMDQEFGDADSGRPLRRMGARFAAVAFNEPRLAKADDGYWMDMAKEVDPVLYGRIRAVVGSLIQNTSWRTKKEFESCSEDSDRSVFEAVLQYMGGAGDMDVHKLSRSKTPEGQTRLPPTPRAAVAFQYAMECRELRQTTRQLLATLLACL